MSALATRSDNASAVAAAPDRNFFENYAEAANRNRIVGELLKFSKGDWLAGQNGEEIRVGTQMVAAVSELMVGWLKWEDNKPVDMRMGRVADGFQPEQRRDLGDNDSAVWDVDDQGRPRDPWQFTNYLILHDPKDGQLYTFAPSSKGGIAEVAKLTGAYGKNMRQKPDMLPMVELGVDSYQHQNRAYGRIKTPTMKVVGWVNKAETAAAIAGEAADAEAAANEEAADEPEAAPQPATKVKPGSATTRF